MNFKTMKKRLAKPMFVHPREFNIKNYQLQIKKNLQNNSYLEWSLSDSSEIENKEDLQVSYNHDLQDILKQKNERSVIQPKIK